MTDADIQQQLIDLAHEEAFLLSAYLDATQRFEAQRTQLLRQLWPAGTVVRYVGREGVVTDWPLTDRFVEVFFDFAKSDELDHLWSLLHTNGVLRCSARHLTKCADEPPRLFPLYADMERENYDVALKRYRERTQKHVTRFDCVCQKGHRFTFSGHAAPTLCDTTRWEAGVGSTEFQNPVPMACGALVEAQAVATVSRFRAAVEAPPAEQRANAASPGSSPDPAPTVEPEPGRGSGGQ